MVRETHFARGMIPYRTAYAARARNAGAVNDGRRLGNANIVGTQFVPGVYRVRFDTGAYFGAAGIETFYPEATIVFVVRDANAHYHVPLLLSPFGYSTYRGS